MSWTMGRGRASDRLLASADQRRALELVGTLPGMGSPRTGIDVEKAVLFYQQGWTLRRIAAQLGCSFQRLSTLLRAQPGVEMRTPTASARAARLPEAKRAAIRTAIGEGLNASDISRRVGVTVASVTLLDREGLALRKGRHLTWDLARPGTEGAGIVLPAGGGRTRRKHEAGVVQAAATAGPPG